MIFIHAIKHFDDIIRFLIHNMYSSAVHVEDDIISIVLGY